MCLPWTARDSRQAIACPTRCNWLDLGQRGIKKVVLPAVALAGRGCRIFGLTEGVCLGIVKGPSRSPPPCGQPPLSHPRKGESSFLPQARGCLQVLSFLL